jgi:hypothetical protein
VTVAESFAEFAAGLRQDAVPEGALHGARRCLVDWWGRVMLRDKRVRLRRPPLPALGAGERSTGPFTYPPQAHQGGGGSGGEVVRGA